MSLSDTHRRDLHRAAITDETIDRFKIHSTDDDKAIVFPFYDKNGQVVNVQFRPDEPKGRGKYVSLDHGFNVLRNNGYSKVLLIEGTKQTYAVESWLSDGQLYDLVGMAGCYGWSSANLDKHPLKQNPELFKGKEVTVIFDSDLRINTNVKRAAKDLNTALEEVGAKSVRFVNVPGFETEGIDDYLYKIRDEFRAQEVQKLIDAAESRDGSKNVDILVRELSDALVHATDITPEDPVWLYESMIQAHRLAMLIGDGNIGKGVFCIWVISELSLGKLPGDFQGNPRRSLFVSTEEHYNSETVPRLMAHGADMSMIDVISPDDYYLQLTNSGGEALCKMMKENEFSLAYIDPMVDFFPSGKKESEIDVRSVLSPLQMNCLKYEVTVAGLRHIPKANSKLEDLMLGSKAWRNTPRSAIAILKDPQNRQCRVVVDMKMNNAAENETGRGFRFESVFLPGLRRTVPKLVWTNEMFSREEVYELGGLNTQQRESVLNKSELQQETLVKEMNKAGGIQVPVKMIRPVIAKLLDVSEKTVDRVAVRVGIEPAKQGDHDPKWDLPKILIDTVATLRPGSTP